MKLSGIGGVTERGIHGLSKWLGWGSAAIIFLMMFFVAADVGGRYIFNKPITGSLDIVELMMGLLTFLAMGYCAFKAGHVVVDLLTSGLSSHTNAILNIITSFASAVILGFIVWQLGYKGVVGMISVSAGGRRSLLLQIPQSPFYVVAAIGCLLACVELLIHAFHSIRQVTSR